MLCYGRGPRAEAAEALRSIFDEIRLVPHEGALAIDLCGELGAILALTNFAKPRFRWS